MVQFLNTRKRGKMAAISWATSLSLFILLIMIPKSTSVPTFLSKYCDSNTTFAADSNYSNNLHTLLRSLSSAAATSLTGFYSTSVENNTNGAVHGLFLCRGDQNTSSCTDCVAAGVRDQTRMCPKSTWGVIWYDECMIRYNNHSLVMDIGTNYHAWNKKKLTGNQTQFAEYLGNMLRDLAAQASKDQTGEKYATRVANFTSLQTVYALEQCTPDLSANACYLCLTSWMGQMVASQGGMILLPSCNVRYEIYPFFDVTTTLLSPPTITSAAARPETDHKNRGLSYIPIAVAIPSAVAILLLFGFCFIMRKWNTKSSSNIMYIAFKDEKQIITRESLQYEIGTIIAATDNFSADNRLGKGGFGDVYKGRLQSGEDIAVKRLSPNSKQGIQEFKTEVLLVAKLQHKNLVRLLGFCVTEEEKLLIYEYLPHSSLDRFLFDHGEGVPLAWEMRYKIIDGVAKGLRYLHEDSRYKIVHRDLKPSNILLDKDMVPKISDFGLAKLFGEDQAQDISKRIVGTHGYMAPEYIRTGQLSVKLDVYSFGVLVLEVVSGRRIRNRFIYTPEDEEGLIQYAWRLWNAKEPLAFVDPKLGGNFSAEEATQCIHIGLLCIQEDTRKRPSMASIVSMLKHHTNIIPQLPKAGYFRSDSSSSSRQPG